MSRVDLGILGWPAQSLARQADVLPPAEVTILGIDVNTIGANPLGIATVFLLVFLGLRD